MYAATDPSSSDFMEFHRTGQTLVDAAFLSHAIIRAPKELWEKLDERVKRNLISALKASRKTMPGFSSLQVWCNANAFTGCTFTYAS
jgi:hypothetical protein